MRYHEISESIPAFVDEPIMVNPTSREIASCFARSPYVQGRWGRVEAKSPIIRGIQTMDGTIYAGCASHYTHLTLIKRSRNLGAEYSFEPKDRAEFIVFADGTMSGRCYWDWDSPALPFFADWEKAVSRVKKPALAD